MTESHDDRTPVEHDPTGMRALLASLPEPGPMPDHLVARITAALASEVDAAAPPRQASPAGAPPGTASVATLARRRARLRHLGVAAAVVGALGLGGVVLSTTPNALTASLGAAGGGDDSGQAESSASGSDAGADSGAADRPATALVPPSGSGAVVIVMSGRSWTSADLAGGARDLASRDEAALRSLAAEAPGIGPIGTTIGARSCADALGVAPDAGVLVDVTEVDGRPAAVLVVDEGTGHTAYAVERSCTTGDPGLLSGPVAVD